MHSPHARRTFPWDFAFVVLVLVFLTAAAPDPDWFPLPSGSTWSYEREGTPGLNYENQVLAHEDFHGTQATVVRTLAAGSVTPVDLFYSLAVDGDVLLHGLRYVRPGDGVLVERVYDPPRKELDLPLGPAWDGGYTPFHYEDGELVRIEATIFYACTVQSLAEEVITPAGSFTAARVSRTEGANTTITWFAAQVGRVRMDLLQGKDLSDRWLLTDFHLPVGVEARSWGGFKAGWAGD